MWMLRDRAFHVPVSFELCADSEGVCSPKVASYGPVEVILEISLVQRLDIRPVGRGEGGGESRHGRW